MARPTPVLPLVGSTMVPPGLRSPRFSASSIIARPIRSLTEPPGLSISSFATRRGLRPFPMRFSSTRGVLPTSPRTSLAMGMLRMLVRAWLQDEVCAGHDEDDRHEVRLESGRDELDLREEVGERDDADHRRDDEPDLARPRQPGE